MQIIRQGFTPIYQITNIENIRADKSGNFNGISFPAKAKFSSYLTILDDEGNEKNVEIIFQIPSSDKMAIQIRDLLREIRDKNISFSFKSFLPSQSGKNQYTLNSLDDDISVFNYLSSLLKKPKT